MEHKITFIRAKEIMLVEYGPYSKCPGVFTSSMRWYGVAISSFEPLLLNLSKHIPTCILKVYHLRTEPLPIYSIQGFYFIQNSMQNHSSGCVSSLHFSLISGFCVCQQLHSVSCGNQCFLSLWQLCSLCRIISLLQAVWRGWVFKLFWQKKALPALRERWTWTPHCAET